MPQPPQYERTIDFTERDGDDTDHPGLNQELDAAALSINAIRTNLAQLQRDDGKLADGTVTPEALTPEAIDAIRGDLGAAAGVAEGFAQQALAAASAANTASSTAQGAATQATSMASLAQTQAQAAQQSAAEAAASAGLDPNDFVARFASGAALPSSDIGPIWHEDYAAVMTWRTIGAYTGYASVNLGQVVYFDAQTAPPGWLKSAGQTLSAAYAALNAFRGTSTLRDLRAEFIRGWDDGRGVDSGRALGSSQADGIKQSTFWLPATQSGNGSLINAQTGEISVTRVTSNAWSAQAVATAGTRADVSVGSAPETRPRNVALLACIKF